MEFKIEGIRGGRATENFLKLPAVIRQRLLYMRYFGGALAGAIEHRVKYKKMGPDYAKMGPFFNSGGMWDGFVARIVGRNVQLVFIKSSFPSSWANKSKKKFKDPNDREKWLKKQQKLGKTKRVRNRFKAETAQGGRDGATRPILEPSRDEVRALTTWMEEHLESNIVKNLSDVSAINKRAIPDRFAKMLSSLPDPKNTR